MGAKPGHAHLHAIKFLHRDRFLAPRQLVPPSLTSLARGAARHCASTHLSNFCNRDNFPSTYQICTATPVMSSQLSTRTAKTHAIPSLHRDNFLAKVPGLNPVLASGNTTSLYCRAVSIHAMAIYLNNLYNVSHLVTQRIGFQMQMFVRHLIGH
jgi:hypothetical protein